MMTGLSAEFGLAGAGELPEVVGFAAVASGVCSGAVLLDSFRLDFAAVLKSEKDGKRLLYYLIYFLLVAKK